MALHSCSARSAGVAKMAEGARWCELAAEEYPALRARVSAAGRQVLQVGSIAVLSGIVFTVSPLKKLSNVPAFGESDMVVGAVGGCQ